MRRSRRHDGGVTIVEAAFALPILFLFTFGLIDLGMWTFNSNQAANAARDGARAGILSFETADVDGSVDREAIVAAVRDHLPDGTVESSEIDVECLDASGAPIACSTAVIDDNPRIRVEVEWHWNLVTPVAALIGVDEGAARSSATMAIVGRPLGGTVPPDTTTTVPPPSGDCAVPDLTVTPDPVSSHANQLTEPLLIDFTTNGSEACTDLQIDIIGSKNNSDPVTHLCGCGEGPDFTWTYSGSNNIWAKNAYGTVKIMKGDVELNSVQFWVSG